MSSLQWHHLVTEDFGNTLETVNQRAFLWVLVLLKCWTITACPNPTPNSNLNCKLSLKECHQLSVYVWIIWRQSTGDYASLDNNYMYAFNQLQNLTKHGHNGEDVKIIIFISLAENSYKQVLHLGVQLSGCHTGLVDEADSERWPLRSANSTHWQQGNRRSSWEDVVVHLPCCPLRENDCVNALCSIQV